MITVLTSVVCGITAATFKPQSPPVVPNPINTFEAIMRDRCDYIVAAPSFVEVHSSKQSLVAAFLTSFQDMGARQQGRRSV